MKRMLITLALAITVLPVSSHSAVAQTAEKAQPVMDRAKAQRLFDQAKSKYEAYEREHGGWVQTKNMRMHYLQWKNPTGIPLVWAHGTFSSAYEMAPVAEQLVKAGYRLIAIDYYGHGKTPIPKHEVSIYHVADDIAALMDSLGIDKAVYDSIKDDPTLDTTDTNYHLGVLAQLSQGEDKQWAVCRGLSKWLMEDSYANIVNVVRRPSTTSFFQWSTWSLIPKVVFRNLDVPILILDANDSFLATDQDQELQRMFPKLVTHRIYEDTGHAVHLERPAWFVRDATAFLEQVRQHKRR